VQLNPLTRGAIVNENLETTVPGVFACGNVLHVHDVVDFVTIESEQAGKSAAEHVLRKQKQVERINVQAGNGVCYVLPNSISKNSEVELLFRVLCPKEDASIGFFDGEKLVKNKKFRKVHPAQMIKVKLSKTETMDISGLRVEVLQK
ncbi:MAG: pyridine nucleotide-disulfide oxidoreductase, partial [Candidatus Bathyarchaeota archaeon]